MGGVEYKLGRFTLHPGRQLLVGGAPVPIRRKALDLLSVLAQARGALVSKDELVAQVWARKAVEDNAIQVQVTAVRKLLAEEGGRLSTVRGLGYRLSVEEIVDGSSTAPVETEKEAPARPTSAGQAPRLLSASASVTAIVAGISLLAAIASYPVSGAIRRWLAPEQDRVAVLPFEVTSKDPVALALADGMLDAVSATLTSRGLRTISRADASGPRDGERTLSSNPLRTRLIITGAVSREGKTVNVITRLDDVVERVTLWSRQISGSADAPAALRTIVAAQTGGAASWAQLARASPARVSAEGVADFIAARESLTGLREGGDVVAERFARRLAATTPDFSWGHSALATAIAFQLQNSEPGTADVQARRHEADAEARRALSLDPKNGEAYLALELLAPSHDWLAREKLLEAGAAADPGFEPLILMRGRLLWTLGRAHDAIQLLRTAHELDPLHNSASWSLAVSLVSGGYSEEGRRLVSQMSAEWPDHTATSDARFWTAMLDGRDDELMKLLDDPSGRDGLSDVGAQVWRDVLLAGRTASKMHRRTIADEIATAASTGTIEPGPAALLAARLGDLDLAFDLARAYEPNHYSPPYLFLSTTTLMRKDPRFMLGAERLGWGAYWRATGRWPDFCSDPDLPYDCRVESARLQTGRNLR